MGRSRGGDSGYGYLKDPKSHRRTNVSVALQRFGAVEFPDTFTVGSPFILDQGSTSSCTGHATAGAALMYFQAQGNTIFTPRSPCGVYTFGRLIDQDPSAPLADGGAQPNQVMRAITEYGMPGFGTHDSDAGKYGDQPDPTVINNKDCAFKMEESAIKCEVTGQYLVDTSNASALKGALYSMKAPIPLAVQVDAAMEDWNGQNPIQPPDPNNLLGGHYIYLFGWDTLNDADVWLIANSWGKGWGRQGVGLYSDAAMKLATDAYALQLTMKVAA